MAVFTYGVNSLEMTDTAYSVPDAEGIWMSVMVNNCLQTVEGKQDSEPTHRC